MAKKGGEASTQSRRLIVNLAIVVIFASVMVGFISYFYQSEPNVQDRLLRSLGDKLESEVVRAHWQWQAQGRPETIMLVHYNDEGAEVGRSPVRFTMNGMPAVKPGSEGCQKLWSSLLSSPMRIDGFLVRAEYYRGTLLDNDPVNARCRFRLSRGTHFDYFIYNGAVEHEQ
ncbi:hypothetical protein [Alteromonas halophila]|uniref:MSHA biogenesis protein MshF n=1 Tax=Alteromonas halophila TaxID=516698 RepID=A0A918JLP8_9ALTE|nr:hypothetical protein [Alteromonas halophila]GGW84060.1 hypothetical protein GCM10007391_17180 [Alteromonas halophila]